MEKIAITLLVAGLLLIGLGVRSSISNEKEYQKTCAEAGGKPAFNGKFWECLK